MTGRSKRERGERRVDRGPSITPLELAIESARSGSGESAQAAVGEVQASLRTNLYYLARRDDGWLRFIPARDGHPLYLKWKFTDGDWARHYIMAVVAASEVAYGLQLLIDKLAEVDAGARRPTKDKLFGAEDGGTDV